MQAAVVEALPQGVPMPADRIANNEDDQPENQIGENDLVGEMMQGFDRLRRMSHTELRDVIGSRVALLEHELHEREARRVALEEAKAASRILDLRRERAKRIHRNVNIGSSVAAVSSTFLLVAIMV
jgi:hypothetical protein